MSSFLFTGERGERRETRRLEGMRLCPGLAFLCFLSAASLLAAAVAVLGFCLALYIRKVSKSA